MTFRSMPAEYHYNPIGVVHGGFAATLLDSVLGCAVHCTLPPGRCYTTLEMKVNLVRPITSAAPGRSWPRARSSTAAAAWPPPRARLSTRAAGKLLAHATTTCFLEALTQQTRRAA